MDFTWYIITSSIVFFRPMFISLLDTGRLVHDIPRKTRSNTTTPSDQDHLATPSPSSGSQSIRQARADLFGASTPISSARYALHEPNEEEMLSALPCCVCGACHCHYSSRLITKCHGRWWKEGKIVPLPSSPIK